MWIGCGFHVANNNYQPFIESLTELTDPNFDDTVWSYIDYTQFPSTTASALPVADLSTFVEGGYLQESQISCG